MIEKVDSSKLNLMPGEYGFWFRGPNSDFSVIFNEKQILYFEYNSAGTHLCGGLSKQLRFGRLKRDPSEKVVGFKRSDLIEYESEIPEGLMEEAMRFIDECDFESQMKSAVMEHLRGAGRSHSMLESDASFQSYQEALRNHQVTRTRSTWPRHLKSVVLTLLFLALVFWTYSLINISEYERRCREGEASSCKQLVFIEMLRGNKERVDALVDLENIAISGQASGALKDQCEAGDFNSCLSLQQAGTGELSESRLLDWACRGANDEYCLNQALGYLKGKSLPIDEASLTKVKSVLSRSDRHNDLLLAIAMATGEQQCEGQDECLQGATLLEKHGLANLSASLFHESCKLGSREACLASAEHFDRRGDAKSAVDIYRADCLATKDPKSCYSAAFTKYDDPADKKALLDAFNRCKKGAENYCLFLYDRVAR